MKAVILAGGLGTRLAEETTVRPKDLSESLVQSLQRVLPDDEDEADEVGSLSQSAEALRITAAAPVRNTSIGGSCGIAASPGPPTDVNEALQGYRVAAMAAALFTSMRRRKMKADFRALSGSSDV